MSFPNAPSSRFGPLSEQPPPNLYDYEGIASAVDGFPSVEEEHIDFFRQEGYLVVENAFSPEDVSDALAGMADLIMGGHPGFRSIVFEEGARDRFQSMTAVERMDAVRKIHRFVEYDERLKRLAENPRLLSLLQRLLGHQPELFQDMGMMKPPRFGGEKPWHQDHAYFNFSLGTPVCGVWIALDEATLENGCMRVMPGKHRQGPVIHFKRRDWQICDTQVMGKNRVAVPLKPGGVLFYDGLLPHGTPANRSSRRRRALQFHYNPAGTEMASTAERLAIFGSEGEDVEC